jgi:hypothetical protein
MSSSQGVDAAEEAVAAILATPPLDELEKSIMHARAPGVIVHWARLYPIWLPCSTFLSHLGPIARLEVSGRKSPTICCYDTGSDPCV